MPRKNEEDWENRYFYPLPTELLVELYNRGINKYSNEHFPSEPPTKKSIAVISKELSIDIPRMYIAFAEKCKNYGVCFPSIGEDFNSHKHIINVNRSFYEGLDEDVPLPKNYVAFTHDHENYCFCFDKNLKNIDGVLPVFYASLEHDLKITQTKYDSFHEYLQNICIYMARDKKQDPRNNPANDKTRKNLTTYR